MLFSKQLLIFVALIIFTMQVLAQQELPGGKNNLRRLLKDEVQQDENQANDEENAVDKLLSVHEKIGGGFFKKIPL